MRGVHGHLTHTVDYLTARVQRLEDRINVLRDTNSHHARQAQPYGFASFAKIAYAHVVAKTLHRKRVKGASFQLAPLPHDIIWQNLNKSDGQRRTAAFFGGLILIVVAALYTIPLVAVAFLANLSAVTQFVPFLNAWSDRSPFTFAAVAGILPPALSLLLQLVLPVIMRKIGKFQGARTKTKRDRDVFARYWAFLLITQFFIFSIISVIYQLVVNVVDEIGNNKGAEAVLKSFAALPGQLQTTYVQSSSYWLTWFPCVRRLDHPLTHTDCRRSRRRSSSLRSFRSSTSSFARTSSVEPFETSASGPSRRSPSIRSSQRTTCSCSASLSSVRAEMMSD